MEAIVSQFDEQKHCDIQFIVDGKIIGAHLVVLSAMNERCPSLYETAVGWKAGDDPILIEELDYDHFKALLRYIYTGEISISNNNVFIFLSAAIRFKMSHLEGLCANYMHDSINSENVCVYMNEAVNFQSQLLQQKCCEVFSEKTSEIIFDKSSLNGVSQPALSVFLDVECINVLEVNLFRGVKTWMEQKCKDLGLAANGTNMRQIIGDAIYKLSFPAMTAQDFANCVTTVKGLLTDSEIGQVFQKIMVFYNHDVECPFPETFRCRFNTYETPLPLMNQLLQQEINFIGDDQCTMQSRMQHIKDLSIRGIIELDEIRLVTQCCADLANSTARIRRSQADDHSIRNELYDEFCAWQKTAGTKNVQDIMTQYKGFRTKLNKLCAW